MSKAKQEETSEREQGKERNEKKRLREEVIYINRRTIGTSVDHSKHKKKGKRTRERERGREEGRKRSIN